MEKELIVLWKIREEELANVMRLLPELVEKTKGEAGNLHYAIYQSADSRTEIILHERYKDEAALNAHKDSAHYQQIVVGQIIPTLETRRPIIVTKLF